MNWQGVLMVSTIPVLALALGVWALLSPAWYSIAAAVVFALLTAFEVYILNGANVQ